MTVPELDTTEAVLKWANVGECQEPHTECVQNRETAAHIAECVRMRETSIELIAEFNRPRILEAMQFAAGLPRITVRNTANVEARALRREANERLRKAFDDITEELDLSQPKRQRDYSQTDGINHYLDLQYMHDAINPPTDARRNEVPDATLNRMRDAIKGGSE